MNIQELMLGDWVLANNTPTKIDALCYEGINVGSNLLPQDTILPIILTSDILKVNGFYHNLPYKVTDGLYIETWIYTNKTTELSFVLVYDSLSKKYFWNGYEIDYVHELQHVLRIGKFNELYNNIKVV